MKKLTLIFAITINCFLLTINSFSQPCLPEGIIFTTQVHIDNFQLNYPNCTEIEGYVEIHGSDITNLYGLSVLTSFGNTLTITLTNSLTCLNGLNNVTSIGQHLQIMNNDSLTTLQGLEKLTSVGSAMLITQNLKLFNLAGLDSLCSIGWKLTISFNNTLTSLEGMENLTTIGGDLLIEQNPSLTSLEGLESLTSITGAGVVPPQGGSLLIADNVALSNLTSLINLSSIEGDLYIQGNDVLTSLEGLDNIEANSIHNLWIWENQSLSTCEAQSVCDYLLAPNGQILISDNTTGCNSLEEVEEACETVSLEELLAGSPCLIFPNPVTEKLTLDCSGMTGNIELIEIYNTFGAEVAAYRVNQKDTEMTMDVKALPPGLYFLRLQAGNEVRTGKVIKQ